MTYKFFVPGIPAPGGSKKAFVIPGTRRANVVDDCSRNKDWRACVSYTAKQYFMRPPTDKPVEVDVAFYSLRPKYHFGTGKNAGKLKPDSPVVNAKKPDATKLWRAAEDALTGIIWVDDSQIWKQTIRKIYSDISGMEITITFNEQPKPIVPQQSNQTQGVLL